MTPEVLGGLPHLTDWQIRLHSLMDRGILAVMHDKLRPEYDLDYSMAVRGKYHERLLREESKMNYLHYDLNLQMGEVVEVTLDKQANVRLLDDPNFAKYRRGEQHQYFGGRAVKSPVRLSTPRSGHWHLIVDLGGNAGTVRASVRTFGSQP